MDEPATEVDLNEVSANLSALLSRVERGERVVITKDGHPVA